LKRFLALFLLALAIGVFWAYSRVSTPYAGFQKPVLIEFAKGTSTRQMAAMLEKAGVVESANWFLLARALRSGARLQAGEYEFTRPVSPLEIFDKIRRGDVHYYQVTIPEGSNVFDIARLVEAAGVGTAQEFLKEALGRTSFDLDPSAEGLEGYLFPASYRFTKGTTSRQLMQMMTARFRRAWSELNPGSAPVRRVITLASLIEEEAASPSDRPLIASVFQNRLNRGMNLDCDPTVVYAALLENKYRGTIYRSDLDRQSPYNTYRNSGLPPGPISNPGMESLKAALHPAETEFLFFVAKGDGSGTHIFSKTIAEHNKAVLEYRRGLQERKQTGSAAPARRRTVAHAD